MEICFHSYVDGIPFFHLNWMWIYRVPQRIVIIFSCAFSPYFIPYWDICFASEVNSLSPSTETIPITIVHGTFLLCKLKWTDRLLSAVNVKIEFNYILKNKLLLNCLFLSYSQMEPNEIQFVDIRFLDIRFLLYCFERYTAYVRLSYIFWWLLKLWARNDSIYEIYLMRTKLWFLIFYWKDER